MTFFFNPREGSGFLSNMSESFQTFITSGFVISFFFILMWWIGSLIENWKRLIMFLGGKKAFFERLRTMEYKRKKLSDSSNGTTSNYGTVNPTESEKLIAKSRDRATSSASIVDIEDDNMAIVSTIGEEETVNPPIYQELPNSVPESEDFVDLAGHQVDEKVYEIEKERNVWVLVTWYCCLAGISFPTLTALYYKIRKCFKPKLEDPENKHKRKKNIKMSFVWFLIVLGLMIAIVALLGLFHVGDVLLIVSVIVVCMIVNTIVERYFFIPPHQPSKERLLCSWNYNEDRKKNGILSWILSRIDKYITFVEEVFYHSPYVIFKAAKTLLFLFTIVIAICITFKFTETYLTFFLPWTFCLILFILQILRFNLNKWWDKVLSLVRRSAITSEQSSENEGATLFDIEEVEIKTPTIPNSNSSKRLSTFTESTLKNRSKYYRKNLPPHYHCEHEHTFFRYFTVIYFQLSILITLFLLIGFTFYFIGWISGVCLIVLLIMISFVLFMRVDIDAADALFACLMTFMFLLGAIFILGSLNAQANDELYWSRIGEQYNVTTPRFDICDNRWHGYSPVDYALFSALAYEVDPYFSHDLETWFPECKGGNCQVLRRENTTINFFDLYIPSKNLSIISVRGTIIPKDIVQDFDVWKEAGLLQIASVIGPFAVWPKSLLTSLVWYISQIEKLTMVPRSNVTSLDDSRYYYQILDDYVAQSKLKRQVILTGHSLGGGLAKIVGSRNMVQAVTFSGPGVLLSRQKFSITEENIDRYCVSVKPANDMVPQIDMDGGLVQHIECNGNIVTCHSIVHTTRKLISSCGDYPLNRWIDSYANITTTPQ
ncbi:predicted protein [Naegleria gruberi]|uniref:Predicted protein n=1 Tax=Naegleria gruberi TaxID=5762 RepID=D2VJV8_NAEGR|nr:uncharacterized protein NAEGRDRAFT_69178 [Naegleria gruberi]EFC42758.1 predicted protein [Naegleria gruberi]|eukprot:XP_002675502.1 predicted protein [Naegleria gruberi strain NEG-M]